MPVAIRLMGVAVKEVVERNYTNFITDVFQGEPNTPLTFHTRILGFKMIWDPSARRIKLQPDPHHPYFRYS